MGPGQEAQKGDLETPEGTGGILAEVLKQEPEREVLPKVSFRNSDQCCSKAERVNETISNGFCNKDVNSKSGGS